MLDIKNLSFSYGAISAIRDVSMHISESETVCLIGSNGAGKTTTLNLISRLLKPSSGSISFCGEEITNLLPSKVVAKGIVHVPEGRQIFAKMTIEENLRLGGYLVRNSAQYNERVDYVCDLFPILKERRKQSAGSLSGGEQQMLAIARGLISNPKMLLLDEPSLGLSPVMTQQVFEVIANLKAQGMTILLVEQNAYEALQISDRAYVLETGEITLEGPSAELMGNDEIKKAYLGGV